MRLFAEQRPGLVPLIWGLNGVASVFGSFLAALSARNYGFSQVMLAGAAIYIVAALLLLLTSASPKKS
jgi:predicted MFS family arabinose efflux permease